MRDSEIVASIQGDEAQRLEALQHFFMNPKLKLGVDRYVQIHGGSSADAKDVFTESYIVFERHVRNGKFRGESTLSTWFQGIAKWQWLAHCRKNKPTIDIEQLKEATIGENPEKIYFDEERKVILQKMIALIGERCQVLLGLFQLNHSMKEIKEKLGYSSNQVAANEVHKCRKNLKKVIEQHPEQMAVLRYR